MLLGDYIDRGPGSKEVLDFIMELISLDYNIIPLMGNHEDMICKAPDSFMDNQNWMMNGGAATLESFGAGEVSDIDGSYMDFMSNLPKYHIDGNYIFVHGGFNDDLEDPFSDEFSMLWDRRFRYDSPVFEGKVIIHGHRPHALAELEEQIRNNPSVINIDTGCVYGKERGLGQLTGIDLNIMKLYSVDC